MKDPKAMYAMSYGLFVLTARRGEQDNGCIINTGIQVTSQPNRVLIAVNKSNFTHDMILETGAFNLSVLTEKADFSLFQRFGFQWGHPEVAPLYQMKQSLDWEVDKFQGFAHTLRTDNGLLAVTEGTSAWLSCKVASTVDLGTHTLFVADVTDGDTLSRESSATYAYYQTNIKPRPAAPAAESGKKRWVCTVCGYIYEGETLPADFICPICKHPASDFEPVAD